MTTVALPTTPCSTTPTAASYAAYVATRRRALLAAAHRLTRNGHDAEDLLQTVLTRTYTAWPHLDDAHAADAYVRRAMVNQSISWSRQRWRTQEVGAAEVPEPAAAGLTSLATSEGTPADPDERAQLWSLVLRLPPRQRATLALRFYEDMSVAEVARTLGCSVGTVKSNTSRGLATLRASMCS